MPVLSLSSLGFDAISVLEEEGPSTSAKEVNDDVANTLHALYTLSSLLITSNSFRLVLSDIFLTTREILADVASNIAVVADVVETQAVEVDEIIRPPPDAKQELEGDADIPTVAGVDTFDTEAVKGKGKEVADAVGSIPQKVASGMAGESVDSAEKIRDTLITRVQAVRKPPQNISCSPL